MTGDAVERIARAVLYEGYALYPYRACIKNARRWMWGVLYPPAFVERAKSGDVSRVQVEVPVAPEAKPVLSISIRFLQMVTRTIEERRTPSSQWVADDDAFRQVPFLEADGRLYQPWQAGEEHRIALPPFALKYDGPPLRHAFACEGRRWREPIRDTAGRVVGAMLYEVAPLNGEAEVSVRRLGDELIGVRVQIANTNSIDVAPPNDRESAQRHSPLSVHAVLSLQGGSFISPTDPPERFISQAAACRSTGLWPALIGEPSRPDTMLAAPIILGDYPSVAQESPTDLFDSAEIDEILTLRIRTLTDEEKSQAAGLDPRLGALIAHADAATGEDLLSLHGARRGRGSPTPGAPRPGDRVVIRPRRQADIFDIALAGRQATVMSVDVDFEGRWHVSVVADDDPGAELGMRGQPGHRFFFALDEVELLAPAPEAST